MLSLNEIDESSWVEENPITFSKHIKMFWFLKTISSF